MKIVLFTVIAVMLGMTGILLLPLPAWWKVLISGVYGGVIGWINTKLR